MVDVFQDVVGIMVEVVMPEGFKPESWPEATSSRLPEGEGKRLSGPVILISPPNAVLFKLGSETVAAVWKLPEDNSEILIHGR